MKTRNYPIIILPQCQTPWGVPSPYYQVLNTFPHLPCPVGTAAPPTSKGDRYVGNGSVTCRHISPGLWAPGGRPSVPALCPPKSTCGGGIIAATNGRGGGMVFRVREKVGLKGTPVASSHATEMSMALR